MDTNTFILILVVAILITGSVVYIVTSRMVSRNHAALRPAGTDSETRQLQLQAYERLLLLAERISIPSLLQRLHQPGISAKEMQMLLTQNIRSEFDYNLTQQIYVSPNAWQVLKNFKEQNILIIHTVASLMQAGSMSTDLNKQVAEYLSSNTNLNLYDSVSELLSQEAKRLM